MTVNDDSLVFKYVENIKNHEKEFDDDLNKRFENTQILWQTLTDFV